MVWKIPVLLTSGTQLTKVPDLTKMALIGMYETATKNSNLLCAYFIDESMFKLLKCLAITIGKLLLQKSAKTDRYLIILQQAAPTKFLQRHELRNCKQESEKPTARSISRLKTIANGWDFDNCP